MGIRFTARIDKQRRNGKVKTEMDFRTVPYHDGGIGLERSF
jgi:hypothetical protein